MLRLHGRIWEAYPASRTIGRRNLSRHLSPYARSLEPSGGVEQECDLDCDLLTPTENRRQAAWQPMHRQTTPVVYSSGLTP